mgnify:CR=1 FL=1
MGREEKKRVLSLLELALLRHPQLSRDELYAHIMCGDVRVNGDVERDPKRRLAADLPVELHQRRYVSRGGEKLESAYLAWHFPVQDKTFIDAGASTGGFTDFLLQHGASMSGIICSITPCAPTPGCKAMNEQTFSRSKNSIRGRTQPLETSHSALSGEPPPIFSH